MAYSTPRTWVTGELVTAAYLNSNVRDNITLLANPPSAKVYQNANATITNNTLTAITFNAEAWDTDTIHDLAVNTSRLTCVTAGKYRVWGTAPNSVSIAAGFSALYIAKNGASADYDAGQHSPNIVGTVRIAVMGELALVAGDYVELKAYQNSGASSTLLSGSFAIGFGMTWFSV